MILRCSCRHEEQDRIHGQGNRVHNQAKGPNNTIKWRCTVCKSEKDDSAKPNN